ncbi:MAG: 16S rRNA (guanine(527)-N(7))-methyltransferase RsmG [Pseudomonadota bacterium]
MADPLDVLTNVSRETQDTLQAFAAFTLKWNARINLISRRDEASIHQRHIADSAQLFEHVPQTANTWTDLGSGGGFPGLVCAILARDRRPDLTITLIESDTRKCVFLREAARTFDLSVTVENTRIEAATDHKADIISARALAPLSRLLTLAHRFCHPGTVLLFPKGKTARSELTAARETWHISIEALPSRTDPEGTILKLSEVAPRS